MTDDLWQRIADAVGSTQTTDVVMTIVQPELISLRSALRNSERIRENADFHLGQEMARRQLAEKENARLRAELDHWRPDGNDGYGHPVHWTVYNDMHHRALKAEGAIERVRALHERREADDGSTYCDVCSNHGDIAWPCATIRALDGKAARPSRCAECGHPKAQHQAPEEPVSGGLCTACDEEGSDDAQHDYEPAEEA
ncbi:hypothetical protein ACFYXD_35345 [Streptomyces platensis]|uniref:hypothetical protein n=1 Tax=Streptomyces platensis TaxID=58346 RepID=UPI003681BD1A